MNKTHNTTYSLLDEVVNSMANYPMEDNAAIDKAWKDLGVALTVLLITTDVEDVVDGVNATFEISKRLASKIQQLDTDNG